MSTFESDRDLIVSLSINESKCLLRLLDHDSIQNDTPPELWKALAAAKRCPDVSRYFLMEKTRVQVTPDPIIEMRGWSKRLVTKG